MSISFKPPIILRKAVSLVDSRYPHFGPNKKQEIVRLLYEICKRDSTIPSRLLKKDDNDFTSLKDTLLKIRYPYVTATHSRIKAYLPKMPSNLSGAKRSGKLRYYPGVIFIEESVSRTRLTENIRKTYPHAEIREISTLKNALKMKIVNSHRGYDKRRDLLFITRERFDYFKKCPCTKNAIGCGYQILNVGFGCIYDCTYCYLQEYVNCPGIILPANQIEFKKGYAHWDR